MRAALLASALAFIAILARADRRRGVAGGVNVLTLVTLLVLALLGVGVLAGRCRGTATRR